MTRSRSNKAQFNRGPEADAPLSAAEQSLAHLLETYVRPTMAADVWSRIAGTLEEFKRTTYGRGYVQGARDGTYSGPVNP